MEQNQMALEILNLPANVGGARLAVGTFASALDFSLAELDEIKVAVSEAVTNAVVHAYPDRPGVVRVEAKIDGDRLIVTVTDHGAGIPDVSLARRASYSTDPERMGLGFVFMESFMDHLNVESSPGGTKVTMVKTARLAADDLTRLSGEPA